MALYKTEGVVLRLFALGEADRIVTLLTPDKGKVRAVAKGVRRTRSRMVGCTQLFAHGRFMIYEGKNLDTITQGEITHAFRGLREDLQRMACASYVAELLDKLVEEGDGDAELFHLLLSAYTMLSEADRQTVVLRAFEIKLMSLLGYRPALDGCVAYGCDEAGGGWYFSSEAGGLLCASCAGRRQVAGRPGSVHPDAERVSAGAVAGMRRLLERPVAESPIFRPSPSVEAELERTMTAYVLHRLPSPLKSIGFLRDVFAQTTEAH